MDTFTPVAHLGEFGLIDRMRSTLGAPTDPDLLMGIGDDAAVYRTSEEDVHVVTTDTIVEGVHFDRGFMPWSFLGRKIIAVNVSDVAAMNLEPKYATVSVGLPRNVSVEMVEALYSGIRDACEEYGLTLVGGDTTAAPQLVLTATVIGHGRMDAVVFRRGARPGDLICLTGDAGGAYAGLQVLLDQRREMKELGDQYEPKLSGYRYVISRQLTPRPRLDVIRDWAERGVRPSALIDVSDGVASEVHHLCHASHCGALLRGAALPIDLETRAVATERMQDADAFALFGGEDYELLFALPPELLERLDPELFTVIGKFTPAEEGIRIITPEGDELPLSAAGYNHFDGPDAATHDVDVSRDTLDDDVDQDLGEGLDDDPDDDLDDDVSEEFRLDGDVYDGETLS